MAHGVSFRLAGLSAGKHSLSCIQHIHFVMSDGPCWETKYYIADLESFPYMSPICICTSVFRKWTDFSKKCRNIYARILIPQRARAADEELTRPLAWWRNSEPCINWMPRHNKTG